MPALAVAMLVLGLVAQLALPAPDPIPPASALALRRPPRAGSEQAVARVEQYPQLVRRALFTPSRRFNPAVALAASDPDNPSAAVAADPFLSLRLLGTARSRNFTSAVVRDASGAAATLRLGDRVAGWRLVRIGRDAVVFAQGGERRSLRVGAAAAPTATQNDFATGEET